jgi:sugar phosphate isomerase/epimerase
VRQLNPEDYEVDEKDRVVTLTEIGEAHVEELLGMTLREVCRSGGGLMEAWERGVFCQLGLGTAGLDPFLDALRARGYEGWLVVEQDRFLKPSDTPDALLALHTANRRWLADRGF